MGYKAHDHKERRCIDCLFVKKRRVYIPKTGYSKYVLYCEHDNKEIHEIENEKCWVLSKDYPYVNTEEN